jgi:hypothetical protein
VAGVSAAGDRGLPATVRSEFGIRPGEKLLVFKHAMKIGVMLVGIGGMGDFAEFATEDLVGVRRLRKQTSKVRRARSD